MADPEAISIFGRASELAAIAWFLGAVLEGPAALVLQGEAGIGKTALWEESVASAAGRGCVVLRVRAGPADADLPFSGLTELLDPVVDRVLPELSPPLVTALNVALLRQEPQDSVPDRRAIFMAVARAIQALAQDGIPLSLSTTSSGSIGRAPTRCVLPPIGWESAGLACFSPGGRTNASRRRLTWTGPCLMAACARCGSGR